MPGNHVMNLRLNKDTNPGGARWCESHARLECTKSRSKRQGGGQCHAAAVRGVHTCLTHGGQRADVIEAKGHAQITAWSAQGRPTEGTAIGSSAAVLGMLHQSWLRAAMYGKLLESQAIKDGRTSTHSVDQDSADQDVPEEDLGTGGLIGYRYGAAGKDGNIYAVSEEARALVVLESAERDRVVKFAKVAHDMGISDKMINIAERWGDQVVTRIMVIMTSLNLSPEQEAMVPTLIQAHLGTIELGGG